MGIRKIVSKLLFNGSEITNLQRWEVSNEMDWINDIVKSKQVVYFVENEFKDKRADNILFWCGGKLYRVKADIVFIDGDHPKVLQEYYYTDRPFHSIINYLINSLSYRRVFKKGFENIAKNEYIPREDTTQPKRPVFTEQPVEVFGFTKTWILKQFLNIQYYRMNPMKGRQFEYCGYLRPFSVELNEKEKERSRNGESLIEELRERKLSIKG